jgi:predicted SnoaL-like aldol condensation-catalyzing enzyme
VSFKRAAADDNLVVVHCHQCWSSDKNKNGAGIDIFGFDESGKIVEHWDVLQVVPREANNSNGMF